jgi:hypothetical protein
LRGRVEEQRRHAVVEPLEARRRRDGQDRKGAERRRRARGAARGAAPGAPACDSSARWR